MKDKDVLDVNDICIILNKSHNKIRQMLQNDEFKTAFKKGPLNKWYVKIEEIINHSEKNNNTLFTRQEIVDKIKVANSAEFDEKAIFLTVKEAKKELDRSENYVYKKIKTGKLKAKKVRNGKVVSRKSHNGKYFITKKSVMELKKKYNPNKKLINTEKLNNLRNLIISDIIRNYVIETNELKSKLINILLNE
jgi:hypothetical protein